jgi:peptide chain release factor 2
LPSSKQKGEFICSKICDNRFVISVSGWSSWEVIFDHAGREREIAELEARTQQPDLWDDTQAAQALLQKLNQAREKAAPYNALMARLDDAGAMGELLAEEAETERLTKEYAHYELETLLSGEHDTQNAIVEIKAGAGGTDAQDWVVMLQKMYLKWAETRKFEAEIVDETEAEVAGLRSTTFLVSGRNAFGYLRGEKGVHRLVRISPFDANKRRQTSFATVDVIPDIGEEIAVNINPNDLKIDTYRASGAGGQHVNKTDSAIRITHIPTGIVVTCQNERSQHKNKAMAMRVLQARLVELEEKQNAEKMAALRGESKPNEWGNQDRNYVFHPYTLVKDLRTNHETGDLQSVMNGELDPFMEAYLRRQQENRE